MHAKMMIEGPNWKDAPEWANFCAMDGNYEWWWYEEEPSWNDWESGWQSSGRLDKCKKVTDNAPILFNRPK